MIAKILAVYFLAYYIIWFKHVLENIYLIQMGSVLSSQGIKGSFTCPPVNDIPFIDALASYDNFKAEIKQWLYALPIGTALNIVIGNINILW